MLALNFDDCKDINQFYFLLFISDNSITINESNWGFQ